jgi:hypothetical protein
VRGGADRMIESLVYDQTYPMYGCRSIVCCGASYGLRHSRSRGRQTASNALYVVSTHAAAGCILHEVVTVCECDFWLLCLLQVHGDSRRSR